MPACQLALTEASAEVLAQAVPRVEAAYASTSAPLPEPQLHDLARQLQLVHAYLRADQP
ncbi:hypothetical protein [Cupriavidus sp. H39]|uniref:hypothetical protein n=1 Tax=Cupriavidus sp. H39 TaxID=3401635 RepID=UPI003D0752E2